MDTKVDEASTTFVPEKNLKQKQFLRCLVVTETDWSKMVDPPFCEAKCRDLTICLLCKQMVEAAGIEPASPDTYHIASTCLALPFNLAFEPPTSGMLKSQP